MDEVGLHLLPFRELPESLSRQIASATVLPSVTFHIHELSLSVVESYGLTLTACNQHTLKSVHSMKATPGV